MKNALAFVGLGPLGIKLVQFAQQRGENITAAVDIHPDLQGQNLGQVSCCPALNHLPIVSHMEKVNQAQIALLTTVSSLEQLFPQLKQCICRGLHVVSSCEELVYPWFTQRARAEEIDRLAREHGVSVVATGVNPGFLMDFLPATLCGLCQHVTSLKVERFQDASSRRLPFQQKIGAGLTLAEFHQRKQQGAIRHVGLTESLALLAAALGWKLTRYGDEILPIVAPQRIQLPGLTVEAGDVAGVEQFGRGWVNDQELLTLHFRAAVGEKQSYERVHIKGLPDIVSTIDGGIHGDVATCAVLLNAASRIRQTTPGLKSMLDLPLLGAPGRLQPSRP